MEVHRIRSRAFDVNLYLVDCGDEAMLVDASTGMDLDHVKAQVAALVDPARVTTLYLTHWHADHVGGAAALREWTGAEALMHADEAPAVREGDARRTLGAFMGLGQEACPVTDVKEGDVVTVGGERFEVLLLPGHSPAHTALWHGGSGALLSGDVVFEGGSFGRVDFPGCDPDKLCESLRRVADLPVEAIHPGHMAPITEGAREAARLSARNAHMMLKGEAVRW